MHKTGYNEDEVLNTSCGSNYERPKRVMSDEQKEKMKYAREKTKQSAQI